jgi:hypothetical protein
MEPRSLDRARVAQITLEKPVSGARLLAAVRRATSEALTGRTSELFKQRMAVRHARPYAWGAPASVTDRYWGLNE